MPHVDAHAKVVNSAAAPVLNSLEQRVALLAERFSRLEKKLSQQREQPAQVIEMSNPEWLACPKDTKEVAHVRECTRELKLRSTKFAWVPSDYYDRKLAWRKDILQAASTAHLCKAIVLENTHCVNEGTDDVRNSRYYVAVFQYVERFNAEKVMRFVKNMNEGIGKKKFNFRLAADGEALTGFSHNAVVPFGTKVRMPIILSEKIVGLTPKEFWLGGGHVDCKLRIDVDEFVSTFNPFVADITDPYSAEELATM